MFCAENITPHLRTTDQKKNEKLSARRFFFNLYVQGFTLRQGEMAVGLPAWSEFQIQATCSF
jgi:hypothetical protein